MPWALRSLSILCALSLGACISTRLVRLDHVDVPLPKATGDWRGDTRALLETYRAAPVLQPEDPRLDPLFGGLTTLSFFGADALPRVRDQQLEPGSAHGQRLALACSETQHEPTQPARSVPDPIYTAVWMPLALQGGDADRGVSCDERGHTDNPDSFCVFGRLALQPRSAPLVMVVHGLFDSGAQEYVQRLAAALFQGGYSVLLPDMRDHGETLRAAPRVATTLGTLEGQDLLGLARQLRASCAAQVSRVGVAGVSGGGLDAIQAFIADERQELDAGVLAISPLLDVEGAIHDLSNAGDCAVTRSLELTWSDDLLLGAAGGLTFFGGAAAADLARAQRLDGYSALAGAVGLGLGLLGAAVVDGWLDGSSTACVSQNAIARIVQDCMHVRWRALQAPAQKQLLSAAGRRLPAERATLADYLNERVEYLAHQEHLPLTLASPQSLARDLRRALRAGARPHAKLLVLGTDDDPMTRRPALHAFIALSQGIPQVYAQALAHGGHGSLWVVQPTVVMALLQRFFAAEPPARL